MKTDRKGLDVAIVVGGPTGYADGNSNQLGNPFGHTGIGVEGNGVFSFGTGTGKATSFTDYLNKQSSYRDSTIFEIDTTPEQDICIANELNNLPESMPQGLPSLCDNCNSRTADALNKCGVYVPALSRCFPGDMRGFLELKQYFSNTKRTTLPRNTSVSGFDKYNPR